MIYQVYAIYDSASGLFMAPSIDLSDGAAIRSFRQALSKVDTIMGFKPDDFILYCIGHYDIETGKIESFVPPVQLARGGKEVIESDV